MTACFRTCFKQPSCILIYKLINNQVRRNFDMIGYAQTKGPITSISFVIHQISNQSDWLFVYTKLHSATRNLFFSYGTWDTACIIRNGENSVVRRVKSTLAVENEYKKAYKLLKLLILNRKAQEQRTGTTSEN